MKDKEDMDIWSFTQTGYNVGEIVTNGNRFLIGNGYLGYRGTMEEWGPGEFAAVNLAGIYDQNGDKWREPVNAPNGLFAQLTFNGEIIALGRKEALSHSQTLGFRRGVHIRDTQFEPVRLHSLRFASMARHHLISARITMTFKESGKAELLTGIVTDIWDINGPHLFGHSYLTGAVILSEARTGEMGIPVAVAQTVKCRFSHKERQEITDTGVYRTICFDVKEGETYHVDVFTCVCTGMDTLEAGADALEFDTGAGADVDVPEPSKRAAALCEKAQKNGFEKELTDHEEAWEQLWKNSAVELQGDLEAARALNASLYHLHSIAPRHTGKLSIPARGLSGQTYKGAVFWDSEIFLFPVFVHVEPELAKSMLRYRINTLPGAIRKAAEYGYRGAFYPWESQNGGTEGCTDYSVVDVFTHRPVRTYFRDRQIHISGDVAYTLWRYYEITGDASLLREGGAEVILQCARFYLSRVHCRADIDKVELLDVIGPDEYHERINNNVFTNQMAAHCMDSALALFELFSKTDPSFMEALVHKLEYHDDLTLLKKIYPKLRPTFADGAVIEQFDGYFALEDCSLETVQNRLLDEREYWGTNHGVAAHTQIIKQADVIAMMALFPSLFSQETVERNWHYYEPRTEHGSSLSACMYALTACRFGRPDLAWEHFISTAAIDLNGGGKHWAGEIYIGGTHPAANGGAWMIAVLGFAGVSVTNGELTITPRLPQQIKLLRFPLVVRGERLVVTVTHDGWSAESAHS